VAIHVQHVAAAGHVVEHSRVGGQLVKHDINRALGHVAGGWVIDVGDQEAFDAFPEAVHHVSSAVTVRGGHLRVAVRFREYALPGPADVLGNGRIQLAIIADQRLDGQRHLDGNRYG